MNKDVLKQDLKLYIHEMHTLIYEYIYLFPMKVDKS